MFTVALVNAIPERSSQQFRAARRNFAQPVVFVSRSVARRSGRFVALGGYRLLIRLAKGEVGEEPFLSDKRRLGAR
jgi:hypothetical protein